MNNKIDYIGIYKAFLDLHDPMNDLDVLEELSNNMDALEELAHLKGFEVFKFGVDDTTRIYTTKMINSAKRLYEVSAPLCEDFLGISKTANDELMVALPEFLVSYGIILYKVFGYEVIAEQYALSNSIDPSKLDLPREMLDEISEDMTHVVDVMRTILVVFKTFGAYFAEYQIADQDMLTDIINQLEESGGCAEDISTLSEEQIKALVERIN